MPPTLEVCVDTVAGLRICVAEGVARVELCSALSIGGLTPTFSLMELAACLPIETHVMIRPRDGDFAFSVDEIALMQADIAAARQVGLAGVVIGIADADGALDVNVLRQFVSAAGPLAVTLHRVVDTLPDPLVAVDIAVDIGVTRILTSGGTRDALTGAVVIAAMQKRAVGRVQIMAGSGVTPATVADIAARTGVTQFHASCRVGRPNPDVISALGFGAAEQAETSAVRIREMQAAIGV